MLTPFVMPKVCWCSATAALLFAGVLLAQPTPKTDEDLRREAAIAEFTAKMKAANYPALFEQAANEFKVPPDVLKGVAFAETRWEHLTWPSGETASPETGMPRPYGIMSLWDNPFFGHSLTEAAQLIGKDPEELKRDPLQNMRGAAALLRKLYEANPKPDGTTETDPEGWRYAIRKYCGIPEPDLSARHVLNIYTFMSQGYHQFGIEWNARAVNLEPIRQETARAMAEENARRAALNQSTPDASPASITNPATKANVPIASTTTNATLSNAVSNQSPNAASESAPAKRKPWLIPGAAIGITLLVLLIYRYRSRRRPRQLRD
jgi:hypothetical protein